MLKALVWKELRELAPFIAVASLAQIYLVSAATGILSRTRDQVLEPFYKNDDYVYLFLVAAALACLAGFWQSAWESSRGTFPFLLHRPMERLQVIALKLTTGLVVSLLVALVPTAIYAFWAATPGTHASPFDWSMTTQAWLLCVVVPLIYLGSLLSGLRPARWWVSRLFPLAAAVGGTFIAFGSTADSPGWVLPMLIVTIIAEACFVWAILYVTLARDYS